VGVIASEIQVRERHPNAVRCRDINTSTTGGFNRAAVVIVLMPGGLYATWW